MNIDIYKKIIDLSKRRGILWNSFEIYGGTAGFFDYGPIGCIIKRKIENLWREYFIIQEGYLEIETTTIGIKQIYLASGHLSNFSDPLCECSKCHQSYKVDYILKYYNLNELFVDDINEINNYFQKNNILCPDCNGTFCNIINFNLMFQTKIGSENDKIAYLRPETAQGIFINFQRISNFYRNKLPFGCVQIGKVYRNEISPRQGILRLREFTQAECEIFVNPKNKKKDLLRYKNLVLKLIPNNQKEDESSVYKLEDTISKNIFKNDYLAYYIGLTFDFLISLGIKESNIRFRQHKKNEMAHYAIDCWDAEINTNQFGWIEVAGIADRTDYDLKSHINQSNSNFCIYEEDTNEVIIPHVIEPSYGIDRILYCVLENSFYEEKINEKNNLSIRTILKLPDKLAPYYISILPLLKKENLCKIAMDLFNTLKQKNILVYYDESGSIGKRYRRNDEIGIPYSITIDFQTIEDNSITIRYRDTMKQERIDIKKYIEKI